jgi:hypothetical protein
MPHKAFSSQDCSALQTRCQHRTPKGRQCRTPLTAAHATLCPRHALLAQDRLRDDSTDLSSLLDKSLPEKKSAADIRTQLWNLSLALQQGRVSPRRAAVLAYISSLLVRTLPAIEKAQFSDGEGLDLTGAPRPDYNQVTIDIPGAERHWDADGNLIPNAPAQPPSVPDQPLPDPTSTYPTSADPTSDSPADSVPPTTKLYGFHPSTPSVSAPASSAVAALTTAPTLPDPGPRPACARINNVPQSAAQTTPVPPLPPLFPFPPQALPVVCPPPLCYSKNLGPANNIARSPLSGRSAAWLARLVRDQEVEGSNPFAPTIPFNHFRVFPAFSSTTCVSYPKRAAGTTTVALP